MRRQSKQNVQNIPFLKKSWNVLALTCSDLYLPLFDLAWLSCPSLPDVIIAGNFLWILIETVRLSGNKNFCVWSVCQQSRHGCVCVCVFVCVCVHSLFYEQVCAWCVFACVRFLCVSLKDMFIWPVLVHFICFSERYWHVFVHFICFSERYWHAFVHFICFSKRYWHAFVHFICFSERDQRCLLQFHSQLDFHCFCL